MGSRQGTSDGNKSTCPDLAFSCFELILAIGVLILSMLIESKSAGRNYVTDCVNLSRKMRCSTDAMKIFYPATTKMRALFTHKILYLCKGETLLQTQEGTM